MQPHNFCSILRVLLCVMSSLCKNSVTLSYIPLFYPEIAASNLRTQYRRRNFLLRATDALKYAKAQNIGLATTCIQHKLGPIFVLQHGQAIVKHIMWWSNNHPDELFEFHAYYHNEQFSAMLVPNLKCSSTKTSIDICGMGIDPSIDVLFLPLRVFMMDTSQKFYYSSETINLGIIDLAMLGMGNQFNQNDVHWLQNIPLSSANYLEALHGL